MEAEQGEKLTERINNEHGMEEHPAEKEELRSNARRPGCGGEVGRGVGVARKAWSVVAIVG